MRFGLRRFLLGSLEICVLTSVAVPAAGVARFQPLGMLPGSTNSRAHAVSGDGCTVLGESGGRAFVFGAEMFELPLGFELVGQAALASAYDGGRVHGIGPQGSPPRMRLWVWSPGNGLIAHRDLMDPGSRWESSAEGRRTVGTARLFEHPVSQAVLIDQGAEQALPGLPGGSAAGANGISADGLVVVGWAQDAEGSRRAVRWDGDEIAHLGALPGQPESEAFTTSLDGAVVFGTSGAQAFRWHAGEMTAIGVFTPQDTSANGTVVAAGSVVWDPVHGARPVVEVLTANGLDVGNWQDLEATGVSEDGRTLVGVGTNPAGLAEAWLARLPEEADLPPVPPHLEVIYDGGCNGSPPFQTPMDLVRAPDGTLGIATLDFRDLSGRLVRVAPDGTMTRSEDLGVGMVAAGPDGSFYASSEFLRVLRFAPDGTVSVALDFSSVPDLDLDYRTGITDIDVANDGTVYAAAINAVGNLIPGGSQQIVLASELHALLDENELLPRPFMIRAVDGRRAFASNLIYPTVFFEIVAGGAPRIGFPSDVFFDTYRMARSSGNDVWILAASQIFRLTAAGVKLVTGIEAYPEFGPFHRMTDLEVGVDGSLLVRVDDWVRGIYRVIPPIAGPIAPAVPILEWDGIREQPGTFVASADSIYAIHGTAVVRVPVAFGTPQCSNGTDDDGDGGVDFPGDRGCTRADDESEQQALMGCDNALDDDGDGFVDWGDAGCLMPASPLENPECSDGIDNDGDGRIDHDGAGGPPDPQCVGRPWRNREHLACGLGYELALIALLRPLLRRRRVARGGAMRRR